MSTSHKDTVPPPDDDIIVSSITSRDIEGSLDTLLSSFHQDGRSKRNGVVLIQSLPSSKLRTSAQKPLSSKVSFQPISYVATAHNNVDGCYVLKTRMSENNFAWILQAQSPAVMPMEDLHLGLGDYMTSNHSFGMQYQGIKSTAQGLRKALDISSFPVSAPDKPFKTICIKAAATFLYTSSIDISTTASPLTVRMAPANLTTFYFHHRGAPRKWIIVPPTAKQQLEEKVRHTFAIELEQTDCTQFIRHLSLWLTPTILKSWEIPFIELEQTVHQLLLIFPLAYFWGYSKGFSIIESKCHAGPPWDCSDYRFCHPGSQLCSEPFYYLDSGTRDDSPRDASTQPSISSLAPQLSRSPKNDTPYAATGSGSKRHTPDSPRDPRLMSSHKRVFTSSRGRHLELALNPQASDDTITVAPSVTQSRSAEKNTDTTIDQTEFDMSDDDEPFTTQSRSESLVQQLQRENTNLIRELKHLKEERDRLMTRKMLYKTRLVEREALIQKLQEHTHNSEVNIWREIQDLATSRLESMADNDV